MAKLYYGNGDCEIEASEEIRGVQIHYKGNISTIWADNSNDVLTSHQNNGIMMVSLNGQPLPKKLFTYRGEFKIISVIIADSNGNKVPTTIHRVMDYSELLTSNAEDMTEIKVEDMKVGYTYGKALEKESPQILSNLHTSKHDGRLYLKDGTEYTGDFHVHNTKDGGAMTGKEHTNNSQLLYTRLKWEENGTLVPTNNNAPTIKQHNKHMINRGKTAIFGKRRKAKRR